MALTARASRRNSPISSDSRNGFPPVASAQARESCGLASSPNPARIRPATAVSPRGRRRRSVDAPPASVSRDRREAGPCRLYRQRQRDREAGQAVREVQEEPQRRPVGPVRIVDGEDQRPTLGQVDDEPVQAVQGREGQVARFLCRG